MRQLGESNTNFVQKAYYNGHCGCHGLKVSSMLQADGMRHTYSESMRRHDSVVSHKSKMIEMIAQLKIGEDERVPKCSSDKAHGRDEVNQPRCADIELAGLALENRELALEQNHKNKRPHLAVEDQFNEQMRKFTHSDHFLKHKLLQNGKSNSEQIKTLHNLQTLFFNLFICAGNHGS